MKLKKSQNILICPLQWGLGHAGRMIPLARILREMNNVIYIGAGEELLPFFRSELHDFTFINFRGFNTGYSKYLPQYLLLLLKTPSLIYNSVLEHIRLKRIIRDNAIDVVISDNRFGLWSKDIKSVYVTHMPLIPFPRTFRFLEFIGVFLHRMVIKKYSLCLIPDLPGELNFSGRLSHSLKLPSNTRYIGILSRFADTGLPVLRDPFTGRHITIILSGPEPQRSLLRQKLIEELKFREISMVILEGRPDLTDEPVRSENIISFNHLPASQMKDVLVRSNGIITRSGYTTIMELISLGCNALLIPTPGQTEQEYLADYLTNKGLFTTIRQKHINRGISILVNKPLPADEILRQSRELLESALKEISEEKQDKESAHGSEDKAGPDFKRTVSIKP